jgi:hypothetical protein
VYRSFQKILTRPQKFHATAAMAWSFLCVTLPESGDMNATRLLLAGLLGILCGTPALALSVPNQDHLFSLPQYPGAPKPVYDDPSTPYAMSYMEEAAGALGVKNGHMDVFSTRPASSRYMPSISGGLGGDGAMLRLKWHIGE